MAKPKIKHTITKKEWNKKHKDFKTTIDGVPYIMMYSDKDGTYLAPVKIVEATDAEEQEFHAKLDTLVHNTFGKRPEEEEIEEARRGEFEVGDFVHFKSANKTGLVRGIKGDKVTILTMKGNYTGDIKDIKVLHQDGVNEMDMNDPILVKLRAAQMRKNKEAAKKIDTEKQNKNATKIKALKKKRAEVMRDMEQEAEPEGGKIADRYGKLLNRIDNDIIKLGGNPMSESIDEAMDIKSDIKSLIGNMKSNGLIKSGDIDGNSSKARGKFKATIYPTVNTSSTLKDFISELKKHYNFEGITDTGKQVFKFNNKLYGWLINNKGSSVDIVLMRKSPLK